MIKLSSKQFTKSFLRNPIWVNGYKSFNYLLNRPFGWLYVCGDEEELYRISRKRKSDQRAQGCFASVPCEKFLIDACRRAAEDSMNHVLRFVQCKKQCQCCLLPLVYRGKIYGFFVLCHMDTSGKSMLQVLSSFNYFLQARVECVFKEQEIALIYENLHPRALAMSTMHTVHRIISSSLNINDLLPRLTRFTMQVLKADYASIFFMDDSRRFLVKQFDAAVPEFYRGIKQKKIHLEKSVYENTVSMGVPYVTKRLLAVPLIEDDVIGVIVVMRSLKENEFGKVDLEVLRTVSEQAVIAIKNAQMFEVHEKITSGSVESLSHMIDLNAHQERTKYSDVFDVLTMELSKALKLRTIERKNLQLATKLLNRAHLGIPEHIRAKKGELTESDIDVIKKHPFKAVEIIQSVESLGAVVPIVLYHHEWYDGTGYPHGLRGEEIPLTARIVSLVMVFIALISDRPYRVAKTIGVAVEEIVALSGSQFDPKVVDAFLRIIKKNEIKMLLVKSVGKKESDGTGKKSRHTD